MKLEKEESSSVPDVQLLEGIKRSVGARKQRGLHMITKKKRSRMFEREES